MTMLELRRHQPAVMELREASATTREFRGFATAYDSWYDVAGGPEVGGWREMVVAGAGRRTLNARPDVRLLFNHDGMALARTRSGTLLLEEQDAGLLTIAPELDLRQTLVNDLAISMDRRDTDEMSFAFRVTRQEWNADYTERRILEYDLHITGSDVSIVTYPANPATVAQMRAAVNIDELRAAGASSPGMSLAYARAIAAQVSAHR